MAADLKNSTSALIGRLAAVLLSTTEATIWPMPTDVGGDLVLRLTNGSNEGGTGAAARAYISLVDPADSGVGISRIQTKSLAPGESIDIPVSMGPGQFLSGKAETASVITAVLHGISFTSLTGAVSGIQDDAIGSGGRTSGTGTVGGTNAIGTGSNRYLLAALTATMTTTGPSYTGYDTLGMSIPAGAMTRLISVDFNDGGSLGGSVHLFGYDEPPSNTNQALTANVAESGKSFNLTMDSISLAGVGSVGATASTGPTSAAAMSLALASALGRRVFVAAGFDEAPQDFTIGGLHRLRGFNGNKAVGFTRPHWSVFADAIGAAMVTATAASQAHCGVAAEFIPA